MTFLLVTGLIAALLFVGKQWLDARSERDELQRQIAFLKRRLVESRH